MPLPNQLGKALPSASKINKSLNSSRSWNHGLMIFIISPENNHANRYRLCTSGWNMCTRLCNSFSDQTNAIPHWLWNQPSAPPVHPEDGVKGCLGNAMKVSEPQKMSSCHSQINLARLYPLQAKSINPWIQVDHGIMRWWFLNICIISPENNHANRYRLCTMGGTCVQDCATHSVIRLMRYLTGCGISPLHHRFTPKMESKGVSEMLWKCRSRKKCHHATPKSTWQGSTLCKQNQ